MYNQSTGGYNNPNGAQLGIPNLTGAGAPLTQAQTIPNGSQLGVPPGYSGNYNGVQYNMGNALPNWAGGVNPNPAAAPPGGWGLAVPAGSTLPSGPVSGYNPAYGGVPSMPNPTSTQTSAILGNVGNLGNLYGLAQGSGAASGAGALAQLNNNLPGATGAQQLALGNTNSLLSGQIPADVLGQLQQASAERAAATGMAPGSPNIESGLLRSIGLTSLGLQQTGLQNLGSLIGMTPMGPQFNPSSMLVNPGEYQSAQYGANVLGAAPIPAQAAAANLAAQRAGLGAGRGATQPQPTDPNATTGQQGSGALGFGFGTLGSLQAPPKTLTGALGSALADSSGGTGDESMWMNPDELSQWNSMSPDDQYMEQLLGYPSFSSDQQATVPGDDVQAGLSTGDQNSMDASNPDFWSTDNLLE